MTGAAVRGPRNPFRSRLRAGVVVVLLALVTGFLALMVQAALASRDQIARLDARVQALVELREAGAFGTGGFGGKVVNGTQITEGSKHLFLLGTNRAGCRDHVRGGEGREGREVDRSEGRQAVKAAALAALVGAMSASIATPTAAASLTTDVDGVRIEVSSAPETPVKDRKTAYAVRLVDPTGKPISDARVTLTGRMADGMSVAVPLRSSGTPGVYRGDVLFTMAGPWDLAIRVVRQGRRLEVPLKEEVGR